MNNARDIIEKGPLTRFQWTAIAITVGLYALDGFDVLAISFASAWIAQEWGVQPATLGVVLSMEIIGMSIGSVVVGGMADRIGRRRTILASLVVISLGMIAVVFVDSIVMLAVCRLLTGLGIGGMLPAIAATAAEHANAKSRTTAVTIAAAGYAVGAAIGGLIATALLRHYDWRSVFIFGGTLTFAFIPLVLWRVPETIAWLVAKRPADALERINSILRRMGHRAADVLPPVEEASERASVARLFGPGLRLTTILLTVTYFANIATFYYVVKWTPRIAISVGYSAAQSADVLAWNTIGSAIGCLVFGLLTSRVSVYRLTVGVGVAATLFVVLMGFGAGNLMSLKWFAALAGFFSSSMILGMYALMADMFPTSLRASGIGFVIGVGRAAASLAPIMAGVLFQMSFSTGFVSAVMGAGSLLAALLILVIRTRRPALGVQDANG